VSRADATRYYNDEQRRSTFKGEKKREREREGVHENVFIARGSYGGSYRRVITLIAAIKSRCHPRGRQLLPEGCALSLPFRHSPAFSISATPTPYAHYVDAYAYHEIMCVAWPVNCHEYQKLFAIVVNILFCSITANTIGASVAANQGVNCV